MTEMPSGPRRVDNLFLWFFEPESGGAGDRSADVLNAERVFLHEARRQEALAAGEIACARPGCDARITNEDGAAHFRDLCDGVCWESDGSLSEVQQHGVETIQARLLAEDG